MSDEEDIDMEEEEEEQEELDLGTPEVVTKYKAASEIANLCLEYAMSLCVAGTKVVDVCEKTDNMLSEKTAGAFNKKNSKGEKVEKGIAFPTCVSLNGTVCHFSPTKDDKTTIADGDIVKLDLGCHIDGFVAVAAHTLVVQADPKAPVTGPAANVIAAANTALEVAMRMMKPGNKNNAIGPVLEKIAEAYGVNVVEGVLSHQMKRFVIDANKVILNKQSPECKADESTFEENEVYALDIAMSTGDGKPKVVDEKETNVYKRALEKEYHLKMKASRYLFSEINKKFPMMPFTMRCIEEVGKAKLGLVECLNHELLHPYPVLHEKPGDLVAHIKATILIMPNGIDRTTSAPLQTLEPDKKLEDEEILATLATSLKSKKKNKKKKNKEGAAE